MATRDTIVSVCDSKTGYSARIRVSSKILDRALSDDYDPRSALPSPAMRSAQDHICIQARKALAKKGRLQRYLAWADIADSVRASDRIPPRSDVSISATAQTESQPTSDEPQHGFGQMKLFDAAQALF